ncbi:MAG: hypothetical protein HY670_00095 [Chloroflexi bacterium]|nr:hypothetical protein [Chloroflexota bacterium]
MFGWHGTVLNVDLTKGEAKRETVPEALLHEWLGGEGLGSYWLYHEVPPGTDALAPDMLFMVMPGPASGTLCPGSGRLEIVTKSCHADIIGDSNVGGDFGPELHQAGYDGIKIRGRASKPTYLLIDDDHAELRDASHLWGLPHIEAIERLKLELNDPHLKTLSIGPAGERAVRVAVCYSGRRSAAGWCGSGAVMGAKNLKLIAVRGTKGINVADPEAFEEACRSIMDKMMAGPFYWLFGELGVLGMVSTALRNAGVYDGRNRQDTNISEEDFRKSAYLGLSRHKKKNAACFGCFLHCKHIVDIKSGPYAGTRMKGIEFYPSTALGCNLGIYNTEFVLRAVHDCDIYGLDVVNTGTLLGFAAELYQRGIVSKEDTEGLDLTWGNEAAFLGLIAKIGKRGGFGDVLADGIDVAVARLGKETRPYAMTVKGGPLIGSGLGYVPTFTLAALTAPNANWDKGAASLELGEGLVPGLGEKRAQQYFGIPTLHPESMAGKEKIVVWAEDVRVIDDSVPSCAFMGEAFGQGVKRGISVEDCARLLTALTGVDYDADRLKKIAARVNVLQMAYNAREGLRRADFVVPERMFEPLQGGPRHGYAPSAEQLYAALDRYFVLRGFDPKTALPTREGLERAGLTSIADEFERKGLLADGTAAI